MTDCCIWCSTALTAAFQRDIGAQSIRRSVVGAWVLGMGDVGFLWCRYGSSRRMPGPTADSPNSWAKQQQDPKGARAGAGGVTNTLGAPGGTQEEGSDMEDEGHSTGSRMPSGIPEFSGMPLHFGIACYWGPMSCESVRRWTVSQHDWELKSSWV